MAGTQVRGLLYTQVCNPNRPLCVKQALAIEMEHIYDVLPSNNFKVAWILVPDRQTSVWFHKAKV